MVSELGVACQVCNLAAELGKKISHPARKSELQNFARIRTSGAAHKLGR